MKKFGKILLSVLGGIMTFWIVAAVALSFYFTKERILALVLPKARQALNRPVSVTGATFSAWGKIKINLAGVRIKNRPGFSDSLLFSAQKIALAVKILPLLRKQVEITSLELDAPVISYGVLPSGVSNVADWFAPSQGKKETQRGGGAVFLLVEHLKVSDGQIRYQNDSTSTLLFLARMNLDGKTDYNKAAKKLDFTGKLTSGLLRYRSPKQSFETEKLMPEVAYRLSYSLPKDRMEVRSVALKFGPIALLASGEITGLRGQKKGRLDIKSEEFSAAALKESFAAFLPDAAKDWKVSGKGKVNGQLNFASPVQGKVGLALNQFELTAPQIKEKIRIEKVDATVDLGQKQFILATSNASWGGEPFRFGLVLNDWERQDLKLDFKGRFNLALVPELFKLPDTKLSGEFSPDISLYGSAKNKESFKLDGRISIKDVSYSSAKSKYPITDLNAELGFAGKDISQLKLSLKAGRSDIAINGKVANGVAWAVTKRKTPATVTFDFHSNFLDFDQLFPPPEQTTGGGVKIDTVPLPDWNGAGNVYVAKGVFNKLAFGNFRSPMKIDNGVINMNGFVMDMLGGKVNGDLRRDLTDFTQPKFDMKVWANGVEANDFLSALSPVKGILFGKMNLAGDFSGSGLVASEVARSLTASGDLDIDSGKLVRFGPLAKLGEKLGQDWKKEQPLKNLKALFRMENGKIVFNPLNFGLPLGDFKVKGSLGLDGALDFLVDSKVPVEVAEKFDLPPALLDFMKDAEGKIPVSFSLTGTGSEPKISLNLPGAQQKKESLVQDKKEDLKKKGSEFLKKLKPK